MKISGEAFKAAIGACISEEMAALLLAPPELEDDRLEAMFATIFGEEAMTVELTSVSILSPPDALMLSAVDALQHPMLTAPLEMTLGSALAAPIRAGLRRFDLDPAWPAYRSVGLTRLQGGFAGSATLAFGTHREIMVTAIYGPTDRSPLTSTTTLDGDALFRVGISARVGVIRVAPIDELTAERMRRFELLQALSARMAPAD